MNDKRVDDDLAIKRDIDEPGRDINSVANADVF